VSSLVKKSAHCSIYSDSFILFREHFKIHTLSRTTLLKIITAVMICVHVRMYMATLTLLVPVSFLVLFTTFNSTLHGTRTIRRHTFRPRMLFPEVFTSPFYPRKSGLVGHLAYSNLTLDMVSHNQQNSTNPWIGWAFSIT
jgi:hypothetical protein